VKNIYLIGMMGCGKTTCATALGETLGRTVVDTDQAIVAREGRSISDIFAQEGEGYFRDLERQLCRELEDTQDLIVATGGGLPVDPENRQRLHRSGRVVFLNRDPADIFRTADMSDRPLGQQGEADFLSRFAQRLPLYRECSHVEIQDFSSLQGTLAAILNALEETV
jgi:shikimate kinase